MMPGMIMLWNGSVDTIPSGWHLCDGTVGTPDLRNKFIVAAGDTYDVDEEGGSVEHNHEIPLGVGTAPGTSRSVTTSTVSHLPPFYALCYIQKL